MAEGVFVMPAVAMQDARQTMSVATIAQELGITRERAYAILGGKDPCST